MATGVTTVGGGLLHSPKLTAERPRGSCSPPWGVGKGPRTAPQTLGSGLLCHWEEPSVPWEAAIDPCTSGVYPWAPPLGQSQQPPTLGPPPPDDHFPRPQGLLASSTLPPALRRLPPGAGLQAPPQPKQRLSSLDGTTDTRGFKRSRRV